jgi:hypothetical protein
VESDPSECSVASVFHDETEWGLERGALRLTGKFCVVISSGSWRVAVVVVVVETRS